MLYTQSEKKEKEAKRAKRKNKIHRFFSKCMANEYNDTYNGSL